MATIGIVTACVGVADASSLRMRMSEPQEMKPGETVHFSDARCGAGYWRQVSADQNGQRTRRCVKFHFSPPEIILSETK